MPDPGAIYDAVSFFEDAMQNTVISIVLRSVLSAGLSCILQPQAAATAVTHEIVRSCNGVAHDRCVVPNALPARGMELE